MEPLVNQLQVEHHTHVYACLDTPEIHAKLVTNYY